MKNRWNWQWERMEDEDLRTFLEWIYPIKLEDFKNKCVLDAGCGNGGHAKIVAKYAKKIVGLEKYAYNSAVKNTKGIKNIKIVKGDIETINFKKKFDMIYCVGVLHHLDNPDKGFFNLVKQLKKNGKLNVWVYSQEGNSFLQNILEPLKKRILFRLPLSILMPLSIIITFLMYFPIYTIYLLPLKSFPYYYYFEKFRKQDFQYNLKNVFDKLNAPQTQWISEERISAWFKDLKNVNIDHYNQVSWRGYGIK